MVADVLVKAEGVSKRFCRSLKRSLWYGVQDVTNEVLGRNVNCEGLRKNEFWAVEDVSFELKRGECLGLIGPNGAGKSTLLKMLNGLIKPDRGRITMRGRVGALIELGAGFNPILTARENIYVNGSILGLTKAEIDRQFDAIVDFSELDEFIDTPIQSYSSGMRVRLGFAIAARLKPDVLIIDEVLAVGDVGFRNKCYNAIYQMADQASVIFVSHNMNHIDRLCTRGILMDRGSVVCQESSTNALITSYYKLFDGGGRVRRVADGVTVDDLIVNECACGDSVEVRHGEDLTLRFNAEFPRDVSELEIAISVLNGSQELVALANSLLDETRIFVEPAPQQITVRLPEIPLGTGQFFLSLMVRDRSSNEILFWDHAFIRLLAKGDLYVPASVRVFGEWRSSAGGNADESR